MKRPAKKRSHHAPKTSSVAPAPMVPGPHGGQLRRGNPGNRGRAREAWAQECQKAVRSARLLKLLTGLASGDILEEIGRDRKGEPIYGATPGHVRVRAAELLLHYAYGKPTQPLAGEGLEPIQAHVVVEYE